MNIYLVARTDACSYNEQCSVVVIAADEASARSVAAYHAGDEGRDCWFAPLTTVELLGTANPHTAAGLVDRLVCRDFWAG